MIPIKIQNPDPEPEEELEEQPAVLTDQPKRAFPGHGESSTTPHGRNCV